MTKVIWYSIISVSYTHLSGKEKCGKHISDLGLCESRISIGDFLENCFVHMQNMMFLIVITDLHLGTKGKLAGICLNKTVDDLQHGGDVYKRQGRKGSL